MLRGINVGGHHKIKMDDLRGLYESLKFEDVRTYVQSGNVIFRSKEKGTAALARKIEEKIESEYGFRAPVILRTADEMRRAMAANPFAAHCKTDPGKVLVTFLDAEFSAEARSALASFKDYPEELRAIGRELYIYFPNGAGNSKLPWSSIEKLLKTQGTARNWNSVTKILEIAAALEKA